MAVKNDWINTPEGAQENDLENGLSADQVIAAMRAAGQAPNPEPVQTANVVAGASSSIANGGINAKPVEEETKDEDGDGVPDAQTQYEVAKENYDRVNAEIAEENAKIREAQNKTFTDMMNEEYDRQQEERRRMRIQEQANMMSGMATNTTELAAGIINLFSVGQLHANNQQYRTSTDWMAKADRDMREHRMRHDNMGATMQRLKLQQQQVATAGRIEDMKVRQAQAQAALRDAERAKALDDKERMEKADRDANMLIRGFVPDESDPSGYRFDPNLAQQLADSKKAAKTGVSGVGKTSGGAKAVTGSGAVSAGNAPASATSSEMGRTRYIVPADSVKTSPIPASSDSGTAAAAQSKAQTQTRDGQRASSGNAGQQGAKTSPANGGQTGEAPQMSEAAADALARFYAAGGTPEMLVNSANGNGNRRYNRTTFLPPTQKDWNRGIDKRNSPQARNAGTHAKKDWSQYKL